MSVFTYFWELSAAHSQSLRENSKHLALYLFYFSFKHLLIQCESSGHYYYIIILLFYNSLQNAATPSLIPKWLLNMTTLCILWYVRHATMDSQSNALNSSWIHSLLILHMQWINAQLKYNSLIRSQVKVMALNIPLVLSIYQCYFRILLLETETELPWILFSPANFSSELCPVNMPIVCRFYSRTTQNHVPNSQIITYIIIVASNLYHMKYKNFTFIKVNFCSNSWIKRNLP